jgi:hypothetical protein
MLGVLNELSPSLRRHDRRRKGEVTTTTVFSIEFCSELELFGDGIEGFDG